jgi:enoyl-CoA hydratase/carnithine racemase
VNRVAPAAEVLSAAEALARTIMAKAPIPIAMLKGALESGVQSDLATAMALETAATIACFLTEDAREGARAFVEKRPPSYRGR